MKVYYHEIFNIHHSAIINPYGNMYSRSHSHLKTLKVSQ